MYGYSTSQSFTRPNDTTPYGSGDLIANSTTAGSVAPMTFLIPNQRYTRITKAKVMKSGSTATNANFRLHLYQDSPTVTNGDNGAIVSIEANYIGFINVDCTGSTFSDDCSGVGVFVTNSVYAPLSIYGDADHLIYGLLEARAAYTPGALEVFTITLTGETVSP